jgi:predicted HNH restriction endonuclease
MKRKPTTPRSKIRSALRQLWMRSRERAAALKGTGYCCAECGIKQSVAKGREVKMQVHHDPQIDWDGIAEIIETRILRANQYPLCEKCHAEAHKNLP